MAERTISAVDNEARLSSSPRASANNTSGPQRLTRSSARQVAQASRSSGLPAAAASSANGANESAEPSPTAPSTRKRKATAVAGEAKSTNATSPASDTAPSTRQSKRQKVPQPAASRNTDTSPPNNVRNKRKGKTAVVMDNTDGSSGPPNPPQPAIGSASSSRKSSRSKKPAQGTEATSGSSSSRKSKKTPSNPDEDTAMTGTDDVPDPAPASNSDPRPDDKDEETDEDEEEAAQRRYEEEGESDDDDDPFSAFGGPGGPGLSGTLRALSGMMSGFSSRLRDILSHIRSDNPNMQMVALGELSEILLVSNEDNLSGHFSPDAFVKELVALMNKETSPEIMLLACRCLANLMEALPASVANVVYGNAVPVLCQKLLEISFIDLAEQALSTLEKISVEYPASIVREGGLTACLSFLDFFATSTQRTAVTTAANCCRNIPNDSFPVVRDVMPTLLNVLSSNDQRVVEQASLCVSGIVESFKYYPAKLEELVSVDLLRAVLRLLVPGTTLVGSNIHTQFLRVLAITARSSPRLSAELFKLNVVETLYQILTGVSPPSGTEDVASKLDSVVIMQALIHRPREQIVETLNVICELLPNLPQNADPIFGDFVEYGGTTDPSTTAAIEARPSRNNSNEKRVALLEDCKEHVRRFALILFPTLTDAFSSTVNLGVRQKVLTAQLKMLSNLDKEILTEALFPVPYASFLASILSQQDHPTLVMLALQASEFLISRLDHIYRYQFYREGVFSEIHTLSTKADVQSAEDKKEGTAENEPSASTGQPPARASDFEDDDGERETSEDEDHDEEGDGEGDEEDEDDEEEHEPEHHEEDVSPVSSRGSTMSIDAPVHRDPSDARTIQARIQTTAKKILETHENEEHTKAMKEKADVILNNLSEVASELESFYLKRDPASLPASRGREIFAKLASFFDTNVLESVTSAELLASGLVRVLLEIFSNPDEQLTRSAQSTFLEVFMGHMVQAKPKTATADSPVTPFSVMVHKLQDLLSRSEHFEVITVHQNSFDGNRGSPASMLGKQIRLRLVAEDDSDIPKAYRNIMVSIHAIATFKSLDEYLRPRISLSERPRGSRRADGLTRALAAMAGAGVPLSAAAARLGAIPPPPPPPAAPTPASSRSSRKSKPKAPVTPQGDAGSSSLFGALAGPSGERAALRRSSRRQTASDETPPARPPPDDEENHQNTLECADEKQLTDEDDEDETGALDAIVGELQEEMGGESPAEPSAVSMEVASGGNVTARKDDGTRVPTPGGSSLASRPGPPPPPAPPAATPTPSSASRGLSYSGALLATPQDWHIQFSLDEKIVPNETTIYRAVHTSTTTDEPVQRSIWSATHAVKFRRIQGPPPPEQAATVSNNDNENESENGIPASLAKNPTTSSILSLLNILHELNANIEDVLVDQRNGVAGLHREPLSQFVNTKLTAKLNRQLEEPLIVASNCLPSWSEDLARLYPFLFPFETRHLFLQSTSFGYARSMTRWQNTQSAEDSRRDRHNERPFLGRLQRQKVRISRGKILESALKVMDLYGASQSILEVEYFEEVGTGLGPTLEFYSTVSLEFSKKKLWLWRDMESSANSEYVISQTGLFPRPISAHQVTTPNGERILHLFKMLGKFIARSMIDSRIIDLPFNPTFFRIGESASGVKPSLGAVKAVDPGLARSLMTIKKFEIAKKEINEDPNRTAAQKVADIDNIVIDSMKLEDLCLDFTLPGFAEIELEEGGAQKRVTIDNVESYLEKVVDATLGSGVRHQVDAFRAGFSSVFPYSALSAFTPEELVNLFGRVDEDWSLETLLDSMKADHGYNMDSPSVQNLLHLMSEFSPQQRRDFLQFSTGSPKLPIGGFKSLTPMFTVVCKPSEEPYSSDDYLPSVMTCVNYLKLPAYSSLDVMQRQLTTAMREGQGAFHLS